MPSPDPEGFSLLSKVVAAGAVVVAPVFGVYKWIDSRFDKKADKDTVKEAFEKVDAELTIQRGHIGKIFDQMREGEKDARDRHEELLKALYQNK